MGPLNKEPFTQNWATMRLLRAIFSRFSVRRFAAAGRLEASLPSTGQLQAHREPVTAGRTRLGQRVAQKTQASFEVVGDGQQAKVDRVLGQPSITRHGKTHLLHP